jgi:hypothetical protein
MQIYVNVTDVSVWQLFGEKFLISFYEHVEVTHLEIIYIECATCVKLEIYKVCSVPMHH